MHDQFLRGRFNRILVIGVNPNGGPQAIMLFDQIHDSGPIRHIHADAQRMRYPVCLHALQDIVGLPDQIRKVEMAV